MAVLLLNWGKEQSTGSYHRAIEELIVSDFIVENTAFGKKTRDATYRLTDEYAIFYHRFIKPNKKYTQGMWQQLAESPSYKIWSGYAFETLCHKHMDSIKQALGIAAVYTELYSFRSNGSAHTEGVQIDLIIDRKDGCINLCEIKFYKSIFTITKAYYQQLIDKRQQFIAQTGTKKQVFLTFITTHGIMANEYAKEIVDAEIRLEQFM